MFWADALIATYLTLISALVTAHPDFVEGLHGRVLVIADKKHQQSYIKKKKKAMAIVISLESQCSYWSSV